MWKVPLAMSGQAFGQHYCLLEKAEVHASPRDLNMEVGKLNYCAFINLGAFLPGLCEKAHFLLTLPSKGIHWKQEKA